ncbi:MAG TPA: hypothetical protein VEG60_34395 [Candidatus Binatia bacterium]|nr:hypothetical protein [Candidatus Binatia bacterium]
MSFAAAPPWLYWKTPATDPGSKPSLSRLMTREYGPLLDTLYFISMFREFLETWKYHSTFGEKYKPAFTPLRGKMTQYQYEMLLAHYRSPGEEARFLVAVLSAAVIQAGYGGA